jgi:tetratricopeptide (TPR) repeat protein
LTQEYGRYPLTLLYLAVAHYQKGNYREATKIIQELEMLYEKDRQGNEAYFLAIYFSYSLHDIDKSLMWLNRAVEGRAPALINVSIPIYFTFLQKEPRFQEVLKKVGLK